MSPLPDRPRLTLQRDAAQVSKANARLRHYTRGRYALAAAYRLAGVGPDGALLAPAYHCVTMLDPALALHAPVVLYPLHADLSPDLERLEALRASSPTPIRALLATHFFGFVQDFSRLRAWSDAHGIVLVEDCAHVLSTPDWQAPRTARHGHYVVASPYKFFPCDDGGLLYSPQSALPETTATRPAPLVDELRALKHGIEQLRRLPPASDEIAAIDTRLAALSGSTPIAGDDFEVERDVPSSQYDATLERRASLRASRALVARTPIAHLARARRANYRWWQEAVAGLAHCRPLYAELPDDCVPYMFALCLDHPSPHFYRLKQLGVPVYRWDELGVSDCATAAAYRLRLIHLPCHQSLTAADRAWLQTAVRRSLREEPLR